MPFKTIRLTCTALAVLLALGCIALPCSAGQEDKQHIKPQLIFPQMFPNMTGLELMQLAMDHVRKKELKARIKAGERIDYGGLKVTSRPEGAGVLVNSYIPLGRTPYANDKLLPGPHRVTVRKEGYYEQVRMVEIKPNRCSDMEFELKPIPYARLTVKLRPPSTKVRIIQVEHPYTPGMKLPPGDYLVSLFHPTYDEQRLYAVLKPNEVVTLNGDLAAWPGKIKVEANQPGATVYLDGREVGLIHPFVRTTSLIPGPHKLQVWKSLFKPVTKLVMVKSLKTTKVEFELPPVEHFKNSLGMEFVKIPAGKFMMGFNGSPEYVAKQIIKMGRMFTNAGFATYGSFFTEFPQHLVEISKPFFMQTTEVTSTQWNRIMGTYTSPEYAESPVSYVSPKEVQAFIAKLNNLDQGKYRYRLPTEAEWEYAARAGTKGLFYTGDYISTYQANFRGKNDFSFGYSFGKYRGQSIKVKSFAPNPWGLFDMHGNARELCSDWLDGFYYARSPIKDPKSVGDDNGLYAIRGGYFSSDWTWCMSSSRDYAPYNLKDVNAFRLVAEKLF